MKSIALIGFKGNLGKLIVNKMNFIQFKFDLDNIEDFFCLTKCDTVIHLGEHSSPDISLEKSTDNINSTIKILNHSEKIGVKHFIYASSHRRYGSWENHIKINEPIKPLIPITFYGAAKGYIEDVLKLKSLESAMHYSLLRIGTILIDEYEDEELELLNNEWAGKYKYTRVKGGVFLDFLTKILLSETNQKFLVYNILPKKSILNNIFDGKNFHNY